MSKDDIEKLEDQEVKKLKLIKQDEMWEKPKLIRDKLKDKIINIWTIFETEKEKEDRKKEAKWKNN